MSRFRLVVRSLLAIAGIVSSLHTTAGPMINGREWYQPGDVTNYSWNDFYAICAAGICNGQVGSSGPDLTGWVWASVYEVGELFQATTPHPGGIFSYTDATPFQDPFWAYSFLGLFERTYYEPASPNGGAMGVFGLTSTRDIATGVPFWGMVGAYISGWVAPGIPEVDGVVRTELSRVDAPDNRVGAWLYRYDPTAVPAPATTELLLGALVGLVCARRRTSASHGSHRQGRGST
ncbi:MAG: hypothetical protein R3E50_03285 [Halioglobus sp.]